MPEPAVADRPTTADWALLALPGLIWGASFYFIAEALDAFPPETITPLRLAFGCAALGCVRASRAALPRAAWPRIALLGLLWMALPLSLFPFAEERVSSSVTGMLNGAIPLVSALVGAAFFGLRASASQIRGVLVGLVGVVVVAIPTATEGNSSVAGVAMILIAFVFYGFAYNVATPLQQQYGSLPVIWRAQIAALVMTVPFALGSVDRVDVELQPTLMVGLLGVLGTGVAFAVAISNAGRLGPTRASVTTYLIPVVSLALGAVIRHEDVHVLSVAGCAIALVGAYLVGRRR